MYPTQQWRNQTAEVKGNKALPKISEILKQMLSVFRERLN